MISYEVEKMKSTHEILGMDNTPTHGNGSSHLLDRQEGKDPSTSTSISTSISTPGRLLSIALAIYLLSIEKVILLYTCSAVDASISDSMLRFIDTLANHFSNDSSSADLSDVNSRTGERERGIEGKPEMDIFLVSLYVFVFICLCLQHIFK
jgi:hypothetical protein